MRGAIVLEGGAEFGGRMREVDLAALQLAGGVDSRVVIVATAAAPDNNQLRAGGNGRRWFEQLGATNVSVPPLDDRAAADDAAIAEQLRAAQLIFLLGGFPHYLAETLRDSRCATALREAWQQGAVIAGSSAGAMVLCEHYYNPSEGKLYQGLNLLGDSCVLPHHGQFGRHWAPALRQALPAARLLGIDERTGVIIEAEKGWRVAGAGLLTVYAPGAAVATFGAGEVVNFWL